MRSIQKSKIKKELAFFKNFLKYLKRVVCGPQIECRMRDDLPRPHSHINPLGRSRQSLKMFQKVSVKENKKVIKLYIFYCYALCAAELVLRRLNPGIT